MFLLLCMLTALCRKQRTAISHDTGQTLLLACAGRYGKDQAPGVSVFNFFHNEEVGSLPDHLGLDGSQHAA